MVGDRRVPMTRRFRLGRRSEFYTMWAALCGAWAAGSAVAVILSCAHGAPTLNPLPALGFIAATAIGLLAFPPALLVAGRAICRSVLRLVRRFTVARSPALGMRPRNARYG